jgi:hypothetical protein
MTNRTAAIIITIAVVFVFACPGLAGLCWGLANLVDFGAGFGIFATDQNTYLFYILGGICGGVFLIAIAAIVSFFVLRKKKEAPSTPDEPIPPPM